MKKIKKDRRTQEKLDAIKHSRERELMPRPAVFRDKSKYDRNRRKACDRKLMYA